ncbi:hypothetical protein [Paraclostridium dentum]|uniref:hypothetical protein n=1 Tax=Paraclostridium dentum TaxID=2662455 RepID=UPI003F373861
MSNINYTGIAQVFPSSSKYFTETCFCDVYTLPENNKNLGAILNVKSNIQVINTKLIETPIDISNEGQNLLGYKLIVELSLLHKLIYLEHPLAKYCFTKNPALSANLGNTLKSVFIILPCSICGVDTCKLIRKNAFTITPYIENISMQQIDARNIYSTMDVFIDVSFNI